MRNHLIAELVKIARSDPRVIVLTADLGYSVLDNFAKEFPSRCINVGICEQNMTAVAAGLALEGDIVYTYSIGNFPTMRCLEQIRNSVCYHNANVKIVAVGGGFVYGQLGMSHHATEDIAIMRALPNMRVFCPADPDEAIQAVQYAHRLSGPCYIRLARGGEQMIQPHVSDRDITRIQMLRKGSKIAVLATGPVICEAISAAEELSAQGIDLGIYNCITVKPFDTHGLLAIAGNHQVLISLEEHNVIGGLGTAIAEALISNPPEKMPKLIKLGLQDTYTSIVGSQTYLRKHYGLSANDIVNTVRALACS